MADMFVPFNDSDDELEKSIAAELSKNDDIVDYIHENSLESLKARFGAVDEDESIRNEGFELAKKGGLIRKPHPESVMPYLNIELPPQEDIATDSESELSKVFDMAKSEHDSDNVMFSDLGKETAKPVEKREVKQEEKTDKPVEQTEEAPKEPPKRKRGRPRKNPLPEEKKEEKKEETPAEKAPEEKSENEQYVLTPKYNTNTKIIYVNENLDDGIKRNSESELENLFNTEGKGRAFRLWRKIKK
ncbi:MAG: hypothetical protein MJ168_08255 [Clostridia bacterium]|nr:hypothetical protein [Clostridia bacterium]